MCIWKELVGQVPHMFFAWSDWETQDWLSNGSEINHFIISCDSRTGFSRLGYQVLAETTSATLWLRCDSEDFQLVICCIVFWKGSNDVSRVMCLLNRTKRWMSDANYQSKIFWYLPASVASDISLKPPPPGMGGQSYDGFTRNQHRFFCQSTWALCQTLTAKRTTSCENIVQSCVGTSMKPPWFVPEWLSTWTQVSHLSTCTQQLSASWTWPTM